MTPFNVAWINIQLSSWANITAPSILPTTSFSPQTQPANPAPNASLSQPSTVQQDSQQTQLIQTQEPKPLPSPLIIAALIIALVTLLGSILSLYLRWRDRKFKKK